MSNDDLKKQAIADWESGVYQTKAQLARAYDVSARTVGRWLEGSTKATTVVDEGSVEDNQMASSVPVLDDNEVEYRALATSRSISITQLTNGRESGSVVIDRSAENYSKIFQILVESGMSNDGLAEAFHMASPAKMIEFYTQGRISVDVVAGQITYTPDNGKPYPVDGLLSKRIISTIRDRGIDGASMLINFLEKLMLNPSFRAVKELYGFLEHNDIELTADGHFLAWKKVRSTYMDVHSNTMRNAPGDVLRVERNLVDEDSERTCSYGLHVCAKSYLPSFGSCTNTDRVVQVKVDPADVVAIPKDYNNSKMRCAGYVVLADVTGQI